MIWLSSLHHDQAVDGEEHKPEIIRHYNAHKGGVDNHLAGTYSVKWKSISVLFFNTMDVDAIATVRFGCVTSQTGECKRLSRRRFKLQALAEGEALVDDLLRQRLQKPTALQKGVISAFVSLGMLDIRQHAAQRALAANERYYLCPREKSGKPAPCVSTTSALIIVRLASNVMNVSETATVLSALTKG